MIIRLLFVAFGVLAAISLAFDVSMTEASHIILAVVLGLALALLVPARFKAKKPDDKARFNFLIVVTLVIGLIAVSYFYGLHAYCSENSWSMLCGGN